MIRVYLATKILRDIGSKNGSSSKDVVDELKSIKGVEVILGQLRDLDESDFLLIFGHDCKHIKNCDIVVVDARENIGTGTAQEILIAKYFSKPVITILPKNSYQRRANFEINGKVVNDWIHPFVHSTSDTIIEDYKQLAEWIRKYSERKLKVKDIRIIDKSIEYYESKTKQPKL